MTDYVRLYCTECDFEQVYDNRPGDPWTEGAMAHGITTGHHWETELLDEHPDP